jgi:FAD/FMN-containing dehydrogenase
VLSLKRMNAIRAIDAANDSLTCEAGAILETVQGAAKEAGKLFPLVSGRARLGDDRRADLHKRRRRACAALWHDARAGAGAGSRPARRARLSDLSGLRKDNTGYDLKQLFIGAEGTLGVVTAATLKLFARPASTAVAIAAVDSPAQAVELLGHMKDATGGASPRSS